MKSVFSEGVSLPLCRMLLVFIIGVQLISCASLSIPNSEGLTLSIVINTDDTVKARSRNIADTLNSLDHSSEAFQVIYQAPLIFQKNVKIDAEFSDTLVENCDANSITETFESFHKQSQSFGQYLSKFFYIKVRFVGNQNFDIGEPVYFRNGIHELVFYYPIVDCKFEAHELRSVAYMLLHEAYHLDFYVRKLTFSLNAEKSEYAATLFANCDAWLSEDVLKHDFSIYLRRIEGDYSLLQYPIYGIIRSLTGSLNQRVFESSELYLIRNWCDERANEIFTTL